MLSMNSINLITRYIILIAMFLGLTSCSVTKMPTVPDNVKAQYPSNLPNPVITNFNEACACMDDMMLINKVAPIYIAADGINNYTSDRSISAGGKEMLITALSRMAVRSKGVRFVAYGSDMPNIVNLNGAHPDNKNFYVPDYFIRGGVTQHTKNVWSGQEGDGVSFSIDNGQLINHNTFYSIVNAEDYSGSNSNSASYGTVTLDMSAGVISTLQIIPGASSANTLAMSSGASNSRSIDLTVGNLGYSYHLSNSLSLDFNQAFRSLIQVGVIEIIGKIQGIPYWRCLANAGTVEARNEELRKQFIDLHNTDKPSIVSFVQTALQDLHYYNGEVTGVLDIPTRQALQKYQQQMGLMASGTLGYDTFRMMNIFTPARDTAYVPWWRNHNAIPSTIKASTDASKAK
jgi:hypothetical protein